MPFCGHFYSNLLEIRNGTPNPGNGDGDSTSVTPTVESGSTPGES